MSNPPINVGVIGLGMMGTMHLGVYARNPAARIAAISDASPARLAGKETTESNITGEGASVDLSDTARYTDGLELIADPTVDLVDICLPTPLHERFAIAAIEAGKDVLLEKPVARDHAAAMRIADAVAAAPDQIVMPAMCMRFWPGWDWLKRTIDEQTYGPVRAAHFTRLANHAGGAFNDNGQANGGALLDLHIHDTDFISWCFGAAPAVFSRGYTKHTGNIDHVVTQYLYDGPMVTAEGSWVMADGFGFWMRYVVNFERATAVFDLAAEHPLTLIRDGVSEPIRLDSSTGYDHEIAYFLDRVSRRERPETVTIAEATESLRVNEAERRSIETGAVVPLT